MPLAKNTGRVATLLQNFRERHFLMRQAVRGIGEEHPGATECAVHPTPYWKAPGEKRRSARGAHRRADVELSPPLSFRRHAIEAGRSYRGMPVGSEIAVAEIVGKDDDDVGRTLVLSWRVRGPRERGCNQEKTG